MQNANIEKFYEIATTDATIAKALVAGAQSPAEVLQRAADKAGEQGLTFTAAEAEAWVDAQRAAKANGELTDFQLERVAGGKNVIDDAVETGEEALDTAELYGNNILDGTVEFGEAVGDTFEDIGDTTEDIANDVGDWFSSW